jgi:hypothetical protein
MSEMSSGGYFGIDVLPRVPTTTTPLTLPIPGSTSPPPLTLGTVTQIPGTITIGPQVYGPQMPVGSGGFTIEDPETAELRLAIKAIKSIVRSEGDIKAEDKLHAINALLLAILPEK